MYKAANISRVIRSDVSPASSSYLEEHRGAENTKLTSEKDLNDNDKIWQLLLDKLAEKNPATSANLSHGYIISSDANEMKIGFAEEKKFHYDIINKKEHLALLKSVMKSFFDDERKLSVILEKGSKKKGLAQKKKEIETYYEKKMKDEVKKNEIVNKIMNDLNGEIIDVHVYKKSK
jgi:DNA polymerase-3 subunit gamma/tau